jgi:hypothetical protein
MANGNPEPIEVSIVAKVKGLMDGLSQATSGVKSATGEIQGSFNSLSSTISNLKAPFLAITAILAGGAMFKSAIDATVKWNSEVGKLARTMGITTGEASVLKVALHTLGIDQDVYTGTAQRMVRQIAAGGKGFEKLGLDVKDSHGKLKPMPQLMEEAIAKINSMEGGTNKLTAAQMLFGRGAAESAALLRLTSERMKEAKKEAEELHMIVGPDGVAKTREYQESMRKLDLIGQSLSIQIGNVLLPIMTKLGAWLGKTGPAMAEGLAIALKALVTNFFILKAAVEVSVSVAYGLLMSLWHILSSIGKALYKVFSLDIKGAWQELKSGWNDLVVDVKAGAEVMYESVKKAGEDIGELWDDKKPQDGKDGNSGTDTVDTDEGKDNSAEILAAFKLQLEKKKDAEQNWFTWSTQRELEFWQEKLNHVDKGSKAYAAILTEENKLRRKLAEEEQAKLKADFDLRMTKAKADSMERVTLAIQEAERIKGVYGADSKAYIEALKRVEEEQARHQEKMKAVDRLIAEGKRDALLAGIDLEEELVSQQAEANVISRTQELAKLREFENARFKIKLDEARREAELEQDPEKKQAALNKIAALEQQHKLKITQINGQTTVAMQTQWKNLFGVITSGFQSSIQGLIRGTMTWGQAFKNIVSSMLDSLINFLVQWGMKELETIFVTTAAHTAASEVKVAENAAEAGTAGMKSAAEIPYVGWAIAIGAGIAIFAAAKSMSSAAGGWERVPSDQMAMIHKDEQVLPASYAQGLRNLVASGGQGGAGGKGDSYHVTIQAIDSKSFMDTYKANSAGIIKVTKEMARNGRIK